MSPLRSSAALCALLLLGPSLALTSLRQQQRKSQLDPFDCYTGKGEDYKGLQDASMSGRKCAKWTEKAEDNGIIPTTPGLGNHGYCRNPDGSMERPWCFTVDPNKLKEECQIPKCKDGGKPPEKWVAPPGSVTYKEPCTYEVPEKVPEVWKDGRGCEDKKGDTWWLIGMKKSKAADAKGCMETCGMVAGTEYYTHYSTDDEDGNNCGCYRECILVPDNLTINGPITYRSSAR